ncbi:MAG: nucleotide exchange factor GrpE [Flavobacteriales bacterium CG_4_10_14_0_2_um_filter_32_8]|nr:MAG: nucleotide exchange factor GrpE [Flavobacteriales bacterium CG_4_10_14_0_2_um_filter_32_8]
MSKEEEEIENIEQPTEEIKEQLTEEAKQLSPEEIAEEKYNEINNKYLRLYSEFDNYRKRTQKEKIELYKTAGEDVIAAILPVIDDFERALKAMKASDDIKTAIDGVKLIHNKMLTILKQKGLEELKSSIGKDFDIAFHEAITQIPAPSKKQIGKIIDELEKGYQLNGKVIRFTKVVIGQ